MVLDVTAKNQGGENIFSAQRDYIQYGQDIDGDLRYGAWQIKKFSDFTLQPLQVKKEHFIFAVPDGTQSVEVEITLKYVHPGPKIEIPIHGTVRKFTF